MDTTTGPAATLTTKPYAP